MNPLTKIAGILFAYFCDSITRIMAFIFTPWTIFLHYCFGGADWRVRRSWILRDVVKVIANITPPVTWSILTVSIMVFWGKILEENFFFDDHTKVANGTMILLGISLLPIVIWWLRNKEFILDVKNNLRIGEKNKMLYSATSIIFFLLQLTMPFVMLWL